MLPGVAKGLTRFQLHTSAAAAGLQKKADTPQVQEEHAVPAVVVPYDSVLGYVDRFGVGEVLLMVGNLLLPVAASCPEEEAGKVVVPYLLLVVLLRVGTLWVVLDAFG